MKARFCPRGGVSKGPAILFGRVLDADTDTPLGAASISLVYADSAALTPTDRVRRARTLADGSFAICGLPETYSGTVQATRGALSTPEVPFASRDQILGTTILALNVSGASTAVLRGRVTSRSGAPLPGAQVAVQGATSIAATGADGTFVLSALPSGTQVAVVRKLGFGFANIGVNLTTREPRQIMAVLNEAQTLAAVRVVGKMDEGLQKVGFADRKRASGGHFIDPDEVERRHPTMFTDLLRSVSGFRVIDLGGGRVVQSSRGATGGSDACVNVFVDRTRFDQMQPGDLDTMFQPTEIGAIELYPSPNSVPMEFHVNGRDCATIVMWTKLRLGRS